MLFSQFYVLSLLNFMFQALDLETVSLPDDSDRKPVSTVLPDCDSDSLASVGTASVTLPDLSPYTSPAFRYYQQTFKCSQYYFHTNHSVLR